MKETFIHGYKTRYEEDAQWGVNYLLYDLDRDEASVFFEQARIKRYAKFEDKQNNQYTLSYSPEGIFTLTKIRI